MSITLDQLSPVIFGTGAFAHSRYGADDNLDAEKAIEAAFKGGINALDTAAYYDESEVVLGKALANLKYPRESYWITTKAGRWETEEFDYTPEGIRSSLKRSLERLGTPYVDLLLIHDVEFKTEEEALTALKTAFELKKEGLARHVGFSGLPLPVLLRTAQLAQQHLEPVDAILSYCNLTLQNKLLLEYKQQFQDAGVGLVMNASPLGMTMLRSGAQHDWHPAPEPVKAKAAEIAKDLKARGLELADLAEQYAFSVWTPTVVGMRSPEEVAAALENLEKSKTPNNALFAEIQKSFGDLMNISWPSGNH